jgi:regulatory protein
MDEAKDAARARDLALKRLGVREYSAGELQAYLKRKGFLPEVIAPCVRALVEEGLVDDVRYARMVARHQTLRGKGPRYVQQKLQAKGVRLKGRELQEMIQEVAPGDPVAQAREIADRRYPGWREDRAIQSRAYQALLRRGFDFEVTRKALDPRSERVADAD